MCRAVLPFLLLPVAVAQAPDRDEFAALCAAIAPAAAELAWRDVGWRPTLRAAVTAAASAGKPVLLWAMNGHPLGQC